MNHISTRVFGRSSAPILGILSLVLAFFPGGAKAAESPLPSDQNTLGSLTAALADDPDQPLVSITFDDGDPTVYDAGFPILQAQGLPATLYFLSNLLTSQWITRLNDLQDHGWEIGSHSVTHAHLDTLGYSEIVYELSQSKQDLQAAGLNVTGFAYPYGAGSHDDNIVSLVAQYYAYARGVHPGYNTPVVQQYALLAQVYTNGTPVSVVEGWVDTAISQNQWLILSLHYVNDSGSTFSISPADLTEVVSYIKMKVDAGEIQAVTVQNALNIYGGYPPDTTPPTISNVTATPSATQAAIHWMTDEVASSRVDYGLSASYGTTTLESNLSPRVTNHSVTLTGLAACTTYHYRVRSRDAALNEGLSTDQTFTSTGCRLYLPAIRHSTSALSVDQTYIQGTGAYLSSEKHAAGRPRRNDGQQVTEGLLETGSWMDQNDNRI